MLSGTRSFDPPDPRLLPAPPGELFRRQRRVQSLLARCRSLDRERFAEVLTEIMLQGTGALPELRAASSDADPDAASLARAMVRALVPDEIGQMLATGLLQTEDAYPVELAAGLLARLDEPDLSVQRLMESFDALGAKAARMIGEDLKTALTKEYLATHTLDVLFRLGEFWKGEGFRGNTDDYYDAKNSWIQHALESRVGLPITLSVIYVALCRRLGLKAEGVGLPWHFIVRVEVRTRDAHGYLFIDPYHGARPLDIDDCRKLVESHGQRFEPEEHLRPVQTREVLVRMCNNLLSVYDHQKKHGEGERVATVLVHLNPHDPAPRVIRAERRLRRGDFRQAREDLQAALACSASGPVAHYAAKMLRQIEYDHPF
ncbi:MAG: transglutaminase family protein [Planctomycetota bacterium]|nr:transglutaminase family protein [Planctomycetota bacterium]